MLKRRQFIQSLSTASIGPLFVGHLELLGTQRGFKASLNPGAVGLKCTPDQLLDYAIKYNFCHCINTV